MKDFKFKNGDIVKCILTGFFGFIDHRIVYRFGCNRYYVQGISTDGDIKDGYSIDEPNLELIESRDIAKPETPQLIELGFMVYDRIRKLEGVAMGRATYINGCSRVLVELPGIKDNDVQAYWVPEEVLEYITVGRINKKRVNVFEEVTKEEKKQPTKPKTGGPIGGPSSRY